MNIELRLKSFKMLIIEP